MAHNQPPFFSVIMQFTPLARFAGTFQQVSKHPATFQISITVTIWSICLHCEADSLASHSGYSGFCAVNTSTIRSATAAGNKGIKKLHASTQRKPVPLSLLFVLLFPSPNMTPLAEIRPAACPLPDTRQSISFVKAPDSPASQEADRRTAGPDTLHL